MGRSSAATPTIRAVAGLTLEGAERVARESIENVVLSVAGAKEEHLPVIGELDARVRDRARLTASEHAVDLPAQERLLVKVAQVVDRDR